MREILFRGKRKDNGEWLYGFPIISNSRYYICFEKVDEFCQTGNWLDRIEVDPETVGQCIGLTDKKICESDIVEDNRKNHRYIGVVKLGKYNTYHYGFYIDWINGWISDCEMLNQDLLYWLPKIKVIGNIHDNPELLKSI